MDETVRTSHNGYVQSTHYKEKQKKNFSYQFGEGESIAKEQTNPLNLISKITEKSENLIWQVTFFSAFKLTLQGYLLLLF